MGVFYEISEQESMDMCVKREEYIYSDATEFVPGVDVKVLNSYSNRADCLKIRFYLDVVAWNDGKYDQYRRIGRWYELEHNQRFSVENDTFTPLVLEYRCNMLNPGSFEWRFEPFGTTNANPTYRLYVSSVVFQESFFNNTLAWENGSLPDTVQEFPRYRPVNYVLGNPSSMTAEQDTAIKYWDGRKIYQNTFRVNLNLNVVSVPRNFDFIIANNQLYNALVDIHGHYVVTVGATTYQIPLSCTAAQAAVEGTPPILIQDSAALGYVQSAGEIHLLGSTSTPRNYGYCTVTVRYTKP